MPATLEPQAADTPRAQPVGTDTPTTPTRPNRTHRAWKRAACWLILGGLFIGVAAIIDPLDSTASDLPTLQPQPMPVLLGGTTPERGTPAAPSAEGLDTLGSLEGLSTTVWFYAGIQGPLASLHSDSGDPIELVTLEELYRLAPELHLDTGIALMGEVPVDADDWAADW